MGYGHAGLEKYPYNREVAGARNMQGVRASVTLFDKQNKEDGMIFFINDQYLHEANIAEYKALTGTPPPPPPSPQTELVDLDPWLSYTQARPRSLLSPSASSPTS
jgi:hypothetical protein